MESIFTGILYLVIGQIIRFSPNVLAGYDSMSQRERENGEKNGLRFYGLLLFSLMGGLILLAYPISIWFENPQISQLISISVTLSGVFWQFLGEIF